VLVTVPFARFLLDFLDTVPADDAGAPFAVSPFAVFIIFKREKLKAAVAYVAFTVTVNGYEFGRSHHLTPVLRALL
jgi:hypothetical protein